MDERDFLAEQFEQNRSRLRAVAYRMLGSLTEADDAVQEAWLRLGRTGGKGVDNLSGWLTTVVARVCLDMLRARRSRREEPLLEHLPDPIVTRADGPDPEHELLLADSIGLALLVVLEALSPAERLAFVLHDIFHMPFDEIARIVERTPATTRQLASRARRRVRSASPAADPDPQRQRAAVEAFLRAVRSGDLEGLMAILDPDVVLRAEGGAGGAGPLRVVRGASKVAQGAVTASRLAEMARIALVNGTPGMVAYDANGKVRGVSAFTVRDGKIVEIYVIANPERLSHLDLPVIE